MRAIPTSPINLPPPRFWKGRPVLNNDGKVASIEGNTHAFTCAGQYADVKCAFALGWACLLTESY